MGVPLLLLACCCPREASAGIVGEAFSAALAQPLLRGVRSWGAINATTATIPFLQSFINGQIVSYVSSCHVLKPDGSPDCDKVESDCADSAEACDYVYAIEALVLAGAILSVLLAAAVLSCCVVACGCPARNNRALLDVERAKAGLMSVREVVVAKAQHASMFAVPTLAVLAAVATLLSAVIVMEVGGDVMELLRGVQKGTGVPAEVRASADWALLILSHLQDTFREDKAALRLSPDEGLAQLTSELHALRNTLSSLSGAAWSLRELVEGCNIHSSSCSSSGFGPFDDWNFCSYASADDPGTHALGIGATLSDNTTVNPACRDHVSGEPRPCPCCAVCHRLIELVDAQLGSVPTDSAVLALNTTLPPEMVLAPALSTVDTYRPSLTSVTESLGPVNESMVETESAVQRQLGKLLAVELVWLPAVCSLACVLAAALLMRKSRGGGCGDDGVFGRTGSRNEVYVRQEGKHEEDARLRKSLMCINAAFYCGLCAALVASLLFAGLSVAALPLSDVCEIIPASNGSAAALLRVFEIDGLAQSDSLTKARGRARAPSAAAAVFPPAAGLRWQPANHWWIQDAMRDGSGGSAADDDAGDDAGALPRRLIEQCLCRSEGSVWGVLGVTDEQMKEHLHMRAAASVLTPPMLNSVLDVVSYEDVSAIVEATAGLAGPQADAKLLFGVTDCEEADATLFPTCAGDMAEYRNDLRERQAALGAASASMTAVLGQLQEVTESVLLHVCVYIYAYVCACIYACVCVFIDAN